MTPTNRGPPQRFAASLPDRICPGHRRGDEVTGPHQAGSQQGRDIVSNEKVGTSRSMSRLTRSAGSTPSR